MMVRLRCSRALALIVPRGRGGTRSPGASAETQEESRLKMSDKANAADAGAIEGAGRH